MRTNDRSAIDRRPSEIPAIRRTTRWLALLAPALLLGATGVAMVAPWVGYGLIALVTFGCIHGVNLLLNRWERRVREADGHLCLHCGYPVEPRSTRCPECGRDFDAPDAIARWRLGLGLHDFPLKR